MDELLAIRKALLQLAIKDGEIVSVFKVANGLACGCVCPVCADALIARNAGKQRIPHFAHKSGAVCEAAPETALHLLAKEVLVEGKALLLPSPSNLAVEMFDSATKELSQFLPSGEFFVPDVVLSRHEEKLFVEFYVAHPVTDSKVSKIYEFGINCIEIDLRCVYPVDDMGYPNRKGIQDVLLSEKYKRWIYPQCETPKPTPQPELAVEPILVKEVRVDDKPVKQYKGRINIYPVIILESGQAFPPYDCEQTFQAEIDAEIWHLSNRKFFSPEEQNRKLDWARTLGQINIARQETEKPQYVHHMKRQAAIGQYFLRCPDNKSLVDAEKCNQCRYCMGFDEISGDRGGKIAYLCPQRVTLCARGNGSLMEDLVYDHIVTRGESR